MIKLEKEIKENETILYIKELDLFSAIYQCIKCGHIIKCYCNEIVCPFCKRKIMKRINPWYE